jgi:hypothetical protein
MWVESSLIWTVLYAQTVIQSMASPFGATSLNAAAPTGFAARKQLSLVSPPSVSFPQKTRPRRKCSVRVNAAKELYFNKDGSAIRKLQVSRTALSLRLVQYHLYYHVVC